MNPYAIHVAPQHQARSKRSDVGEHQLTDLNAL